MFAAEFEPAIANGRRREPRAPVSLDAGLGLGGLARTLCKVIDISINGARLQTYSSIPARSVIWLTLPRVGQVAADVIWADDYVAGCQFRKPIDPSMLDVLIDLSRGRAAA